MQLSDHLLSYFNAVLTYCMDQYVKNVAMCIVQYLANISVISTLS